MKPVLRLLLLTLAAFLGSLFASPEAGAVGWKTAPDDFFSETLEDAGENGPSAREQCRINGWLNYDTTSGCTVAARTTVPSTIFREGNPSPGNLTPRSVDEGILSFRDSLSNPWPLQPGQRPVFRPGEPYFQIDTTKLPPGSVIPDNIPPGHVGVQNVAAKILKDAVSGRGKLPK